MKWSIFISGNDVVGDMTGVISGAASALVVGHLLLTMNNGNEIIHTMTSVVFSALVSAMICSFSYSDNHEEYKQTEQWKARKITCYSNKLINLKT